MSPNTKIAILSLIFSIIFSSITLFIEYYTFIQPKIENLQVQLGNVGLTAGTISSNISYTNKILLTNSSGGIVGCIITTNKGLQMYSTGMVFDVRGIEPCK